MPFPPLEVKPYNAAETLKFQHYMLPCDDGLSKHALMALSQPIVMQCKNTPSVLFHQRVILHKGMC